MSFRLAWAGVSIQARITLVLFGVALNLPFLIPIHRPPITSFHAELVALFLCLLACLFVFLTRSREKPILLPIVCVLPLAVIGLVCLQTMTQRLINDSVALSILIYASTFAFVAIAAKQLTQDADIDRLQELAALSHLVGASMSAVIGLLQWTGKGNALPWLIAMPMSTDDSGIYGNVAQQNHYAAYSVMGLAALLFLYLRRGLSGRSALVLVGLLSLSIFLSASRGALLYATLILVLFYQSHRQADGTNMLRYRRTLKWGGPLLLIGGVCVFWFFPKSLLVERLTHFFSSTGPRFFLWHHAWSMWESNPWMGVGLDGFAFHLTESLAQGNQINPWGVDHFAHNLVMQVLACSGITGFLLLGGVMYWLVRKWRAQLAREVLALSVSLILLSYSMFEQPLFYAYFLLPLGFFWGLTRIPSWTLARVRLGKILLLVFNCFGLYVFGKTALHYQQFEAIVSIPKSHQAASWRDDVEGLAANRWLRPMVEVYAPEVFVDENAEVEQKLALNSRLLRFAPLPETMYRQAALLAESGQADQAKRQLRSAILNYPSYASSYRLRFHDLAQQDPAYYADLYSFLLQEMDLFGVH